MRLADCGRRVIALTVLMVLFSPFSLSAASYYAVSLNAIAGKLKESSREDGDVRQLGGITRLLGAVYVPQGQEVIIFGQALEGEPALNLDDLVVALKAILIHGAEPLVSIDKTEHTRTTQKQTVRFEGGIADTSFGQALLAADVILKKMGLGQLPTEVWGSKSYFELIGGNWQKTGQEHRIQSRFWFKPADIFIASRSGVAVLERFRLSVQTEILNVIADGKETSGYRDDMGEQFAGAMSSNFEDLMQYYKELKQLRPLFNLVGVATGIKKLATFDQTLTSALEFWLKEYQVPTCKTPSEYPLLTRTEQLHRGSTSKNLIIDGGIELKALINDINDGVIAVLRDVITKSRPQPTAWKWRVPLEGWHAPPSAGWGEDKVSGETEAIIKENKKIGCTFTSTFSTVGQPTSYKDRLMESSRPPPSRGMSDVSLNNTLTPQRLSSSVGGVMLRGAAKVAGAREAQLDLSYGNFSLVIDGENARLTPEAFRRFITALWSVYYTDQDPGVSIDPIEPGGKKHLVRYIGNVVNNDLGRVMREADYLMKKWAVGTEKPNLPGFKDVDALTARHGLRLLGASRRFWFVPEDISFKEGGGLLLFDQGRMTLKTEYRFQDQGVRAEPADEAFAKFFTEKYHTEIIKKYPVYDELMEYAKMVSLANYLKEKGVPLFWFLLANKDQVMVEDSPGTVDALVKGSRHFEGVYIEGGVDLKSQGRYVLDQQAAQALQQAVTKSRPGGGDTTLTARGAVVPETSPQPPATPVSFTVGEKSYTTVPQHSLTSGRDRRGRRYQTDLALRQGKGPGLELVRYFNPHRQEAGEFGNGWHLLIPYRIKPFGSTTRQFKNVVLPERLILVNLMSGEEEVLTFNTERYAVAGYVPEKLEKSQVVGLFLLTDASYRLADKLGNEFWFDQAGFLTDMIFSKDHHIRLEYVRHPKDFADYAGYQLQPLGQERVDFLSLTLPKQMELVNLTSGEKEVFTFSSQGEVVGYGPAREKGPYQFLALMNNATFRLLKEDGTEIPFDGKGRFAGLASLPDHPLAKSISLGDQKITFSYTFGKKGNVLIASAHWENKAQGTKPVCVAQYGYDEAGRLAKVESPDRRTAHLEPFDAGPLLLSDNRDR